ncbi:putative ATP-grasp-modified RiPP [Actinocorallia sp. A-T 12471]|uniref:putative ATP-grasp-modified RiPP n=1 Tax=Actinocorallia sp. A-T 12471 TaxID=3089813 RepID=UPI0029D24BCC|nr:putative ATP-grasp-modified RiPP [Actinocorallia sp. A-T 12471]MDX6744317.1 putative ATP-grasp-modified RiPP [Actinocorallia sp. A-T 12471]
MSDPLPFGLRHQMRLPDTFVRPPALVDAVYDPKLQLNVIGQEPLVSDDGLLVTCSVTYGTTPGNDNKTDAGG